VIQFVPLFWRPALMSWMKGALVVASYRCLLGYSTPPVLQEL
jgi:hypothetical protein